MRPTTLSRNIAITAAISMLMAGSALAETDRDLTVAHRPTGPAYIQSSGPLNISLVPTTASVLKIGSSIGFSIGSADRAPGAFAAEAVPLVPYTPA